MKALDCTYFKTTSVTQYYYQWDLKLTRILPWQEYFRYSKILSLYKKHIFKKDVKFTSWEK